MVTKLTKEQEDLISVYRDEFLKIGLSTEPGDKDITRQVRRVID